MNFSTPSPQTEDFETTAATTVEVAETKAAVEMKTKAEDSAAEETEDVLTSDQELVHVLNAEMNLIESLKKTELELADELRLDYFISQLSLTILSASSKF